jgi:WXG100 family type VII secretion target
MGILSALVDEVEDAAKNVMKQAEEVTGLKDMFNQAIAPLKEGGWTGQGAEAFYNAADTEVIKFAEDLGASILGLGNSITSALEIIKEADASASGPMDGLESAIDAVSDFLGL